MSLSNEIISRIQFIGNCEPSYVLANAYASTCSSKYSINLHEAICKLDDESKALFARIISMNKEPDYCVHEHVKAWEWLKATGLI